MSKSNTIDYIIGLPPDNIHKDTNVVIRNSMPIVKIQPGKPSVTDGHSIYRRANAFSEYKKLLNNHGFDLSQPEGGENLVIAYQADSFPTDSFTNEYGENFLQKFTDVVSEGAATIAQVTGSRNLDQGAAKLSSLLQEGGNLQQYMGKLVDGARSGATALSNFMGTGRYGNMASALLMGGRLDFPMIWKGSSFQPSYTMTIRLYNPNPGDVESTQKYIVAPIAAILLLGVPQSGDDSGATYSWPYIHRIHSPGIYKLDPAFISNITVIKGGDQQQISYKQTLGVVDIRIDFGSLYNSLLATSSINNARPTLKSYLDNMYGQGEQKQGVIKFSSTGLTKNEIEDRTNINVSKSEVQTTKNQGAILEELSPEEIKTPGARIVDTDKNTANKIKNANTSGFGI